MNEKSNMAVPEPIVQLQRQLDQFRSAQPHRAVDRFLRVSIVTRTARRLGRRIILPVRLEGGALRATMHVLDLSIVRYFGEGQDQPILS
jgi:hypothetical protein